MNLIQDWAVPVYQKECNYKAITSSVCITKKTRKSKTNPWFVILPVSLCFQNIPSYSWWLYCTVPQVFSCSEVSSSPPCKTTDFLVLSNDEIFYPWPQYPSHSCLFVHCQASGWISAEWHQSPTQTRGMMPSVSVEIVFLPSQFAN